MILLAHGSRDGAWRASFEAIAQKITAQQPGLQVRCAYMQLCAPDLSQAVTDLRQASCEHIAVAPLFLGAGTHIRQDLPNLLAAVQAQLPDCTLSLLPVFGDDAAVQGWMASWVMRSLAL